MAKRYLLVLSAVVGAMLWLALGTPAARAQGSRKDDIVFNSLGHPLAGAAIRVCTSTATGQPCTPLAPVYSDSGLTQALANPLSADGLGNYSFYAAPGRYMIELSGPGIITKQIPNVILPSDPSTPTFTSVTTTSGISAFSLALSGNLTVNGSTAVAGALTVGGSPVPTASQDTQWTANQRFGGPIPWRDVTKYMPAGGCSSTISAVDPPTTGSISSGSSTLTVGSAQDFRTGCGIAVLNAGPTSTMPMPNQGCSISSIARASNVVTVTCAAAHNIPVTGNNKPGQGVQITGVTDSSYNGTFATVSVADTTHFTYSQTGANSSSSGGSATMQFGYAHGITGATTYNYKVSAVDALGGMSPASAAITIINGSATLNTSNFNWINYGASFTPYDNSTIPHEWVIYSDKGLGGAYSCAGASFTNGYSDFGMAMPCPVFAPATPPGAATPQVLNAIISTGGGTTTLTLNTSASSTATTQNVYHDESSFLNACLADDAADRNPASFPGQAGTYGCYLPAGNYHLNGQLKTDSTASTIGGTIWVAGSVYLNIFPWYISHNSFFINGLGGSGLTGQFSHANATEMQVSASLAAAVVIHGGDNIGFSGFAIPNLQGHGVWIGEIPYGNAPSTYRLDNDIFTEATGGAGAPLVIDNNVIGVWSDNLALTPSNSAVGLPSLYVTMSSYDANVSCCAYFRNLSTTFKGVKFDGPGGNGSGGGPNTFFFSNWINESLASTEKGLVVHDNGPNAPGAASGVVPLNGIGISTLNNSDAAGGPQGFALFTELGTAVQISAGVTGASAFGALLNCGNGSTACNSLPPINGNIISGPTGGSLGGNVQMGNTLDVEVPLISQLGYSQYSAGLPAFGQAFPPPQSFQILSTGAGSLAANTYCMAVEGKDSFATPGLTLPTATLCQAVGASSSIVVQWTQITNQSYGGFRFLFCSTGGSSCVPNTYLDLAAGGNPYSYSFTSTAGGTAQALNTTPTAFLTYLGWGSKSCILCAAPAGNGNYPLGVGEANPGAGVKLAVAGGTIQGEGGIQAGSDAAFNASPRGSYNAFLPNLSSAAGSYLRMTLDKGITLTRFQLVLGTPGAGCSTQAIVSVTDGTTSVTLTTANGTAIYDSGAVSQNFAAAANLDIKIATAASGCSTAPQNANVTAQYRMQ